MTIADGSKFLICIVLNSKMAESNNKIIILPWYDSDMCEQIIRLPKEIPSSLFMFRKYFTRANPKEKGGKIYIDVKLFHSKPPTEIIEDISWWLKKEKTEVFIK